MITVSKELPIEEKQTKNNVVATEENKINEEEKKTLNIDTVIEDCKGFMVKVKSDYYNNWKFMRGVLQQVKRQGYIGRTSSLTSKLHNDFYNWCVANRDILP